MQEELITFKTAKLAKEKGFVNGTKGCFIVYKEDDINPKGDKGTKKGEFEYCKRFSLKNGELDSDEDYNYLERPTQSLLQKWLREVYNTHLMVEPFYNEQKVLVYGFDLITERIEEETIVEKGFKTYEEALELGLQEGLKLI
jgi:hypothetical protein